MGKKEKEAARALAVRQIMSIVERVSQDLSNRQQLKLLGELGDAILERVSALDIEEK